MSTISLTPSASHLCVTSRAASCTLLTYAITSLSPFSANRIRTQARAHEAPVALASVDPTGTLLATGSADGIVKIWDILGGYVSHVLRGHGGIVSAIAFDFDFESNPQTPRSNLATSSVDGRIRVWDLNDRPKQGVQKPVATLAGHVSVVRGLHVSKDGQKMISGSRDQTICLWELTSTQGRKHSPRLPQEGTWKLKTTISTGEGVESCGFLEQKNDDDDDDVFFTGGTSSELRLWSFASGSVVAQQPRGKWAQGTSVNLAGQDESLQGIVAVQMFSQSESDAKQQVLACFHADSRITFRSSSMSPLRAPPLSRLRQLVGFNDEAVDIAKIGEHSIAVATNSSAIRIYPLPASVQSDASEKSAFGSVELLPDENTDPGHADIVLSIDACSRPQWIASGSKDRTARIWARSERHGGWQCIAVAEGHAESVGAVCLSKKSTLPDGSSADGRAFLTTASQDRTVKIWDLSPLTASNQENIASTPIRLKSLITLKVHDKAINTIDVAPNDTLLVTGSQDRTAKLFALSYSAPSKANSHTPSARLSPLATLKGHKRGVWSVCFSPNDPAVLTTSGDRTAKLWSLKDFSCVKTFEGHSHSVLKGHFLENSRGTQVVTTGADGLLKIWNVKDEECITTVDAHSEERLWSVLSFGSGEGLATVGADGCVRIYKDVTQQVKEEQTKLREQAVEKEQQYENLLAVEDYRRAILLCLAQGQPKRLLSLFTAVASKKVHNKGQSGLQDSASNLRSLAIAGIHKVAAVSSDDAESITGLASVDRALSALPSSQLVQLLTYIRAWNASNRTAGTAQTVLHCLLRSYSTSEILQAFENQSQTTGVSQGFATTAQRAKGREILSLPQLLEALIPFSERHYSRAERTLIESAILEYTVKMMGDVLDDEKSLTDEGEDLLSEGNSGESDDSAMLDSEMEDL